MGAGKSTIGRRLARRLGISFVDADTEIERAAGKSVSDIFTEDGEDFFRSGEERVIARLLKSPPQVLATGGGAWISKKTRDGVAKTGISLWLRADFDVLMERVLRRPTRPLLQNADPQAVMRCLIKSRYPLYEKADITVQSRPVDHQVIVNDTIRALAEYMEKSQ